MYTNEDMRSANALVRRRAVMLAAVLLCALAAYVPAVLARSQIAMLAILIAAFWLAAPMIALGLKPALDYRTFLREMQSGLRRECTCTLDRIDNSVTVQDGVRVHTLQVRLDDGDTRIFYLNIHKTDGFPAAGTSIVLTAYGRHVTDWRIEL